MTAYNLKSVQPQSGEAQEKRAKRKKLLMDIERRRWENYKRYYQKLVVKTQETA